MSRELRKVPANWEHPKRENGTYQPMLKTFYGDALKDWFEQNEKWENGTHPDLIAEPELKNEFPLFAMWHGDSPNVKYYQAKKYTEEELTHIQLYETTSEGTPLSPVFHKDDFEQLCEWAEKNATTFADFKATKEQWKQMLSEGFVYAQKGNIIMF